jgi:hypothetical protein
MSLLAQEVEKISAKDLDFVGRPLLYFLDCHPRIDQAPAFEDFNGIVLCERFPLGASESVVGRAVLFF